MNITKKALALFAAGAVAVGGVASIGAQAFAQTPVATTAAVQSVILPSEGSSIEKNTPEAPGSPDVQIGHQDAAGTGSDAAEVKGLEKKSALDVPGGLDVQSGHQDAAGTDSGSGK